MKMTATEAARADGSGEDRRERKRAKGGTYDTEYPKAAFLDALEALGGEGTTSEVEDKVGCAYRTAHMKLSQLEDAGRITARSVGRAKLWRLPE